MRCIGNDVVDLEAPAVAKQPVGQRFVQRVCSAAEVERVARAEQPSTMLWSLFAAKEAAYKALVKTQPELVFAHRLFAVSDDFTSVHHADAVVRLWLCRGAGFVHAVAVLGATAKGPCPPCWVAPAASGEGLSEGVRRLLCSSMAPRLGCSSDQLHVVRDERPGSWSGYGPPRLLRSGVATGIDISLSHDGRFVAAAALHDDVGSER